MNAKKNKKIRTNPRGFSLIELLIVIGLLGALATLVLPQLQVKRTEVLDEQLAPAGNFDEICGSKRC